MHVLKDVGLRWMNCVEPVGPEHSYEEIVDLMLLARRHGATYSGIMRRINFPGSPMTKCGMISELEMAKMVAVSRQGMGIAWAYLVLGELTGVPNGLGAVIMDARMLGRIDIIIVGIGIIAVMGRISDLALDTLMRYCFKSARRTA